MMSLICGKSNLQNQGTEMCLVRRVCEQSEIILIEVLVYVYICIKVCLIIDVNLLLFWDRDSSQEKFALVFHDTEW